MGVGNKVIVRDVSISVGYSDVVFILGPNGSGKTTLLRGIAGDPRVKVLKGSIVFDRRDITDLPMNKRVELGIVLSHQIPPKIRGVKIKSLLENILKKVGVREVESRIKELAKLFNTEHLLDRDLFADLSGGEIKRVELMITACLNPKLILVDEPDSGVDVESIKVIADGINEILGRNPGTSALIVTHSGLITKYVPGTKAYVIVDGVITMEGSPRDIFTHVMSKGFKVLKHGVRKL